MSTAYNPEFDKFPKKASLTLHWDIEQPDGKTLQVESPEGFTSYWQNLPILLHGVILYIKSAENNSEIPKGHGIRGALQFLKHAYFDEKAIPHQEELHEEDTAIFNNAAVVLYRSFSPGRVIKSLLSLWKDFEKQNPELISKGFSKYHLYVALSQRFGPPIETDLNGDIGYKLKIRTPEPDYQSLDGKTLWWEALLAFPTVPEEKANQYKRPEGLFTGSNIEYFFKSPVWITLFKRMEQFGLSGLTPAELMYKRESVYYFLMGLLQGEAEKHKLF